MQRALLPGMALALGAGCALGAMFSVPGWVLLGALVATAAALWRRSPFALWTAFLLAGIALGARFPPGPRAQLPLLREVRGEVASLPEEHGKSWGFVLSMPNLETRLLVYLPQSESPPLPGDYVRLRGRAEVPSGGWGEYLRIRGIGGVFWAEGIEVLRKGGWGIRRAIYALRERLLRAIKRVFPGEAERLVAALILGARGELDSDLKGNFRRAGVAHLLALSGLHLGIIAYGLWRLLGLLRLRPGHRYPFLFAAIGIYIGVVGARISLLRAGIMFGFLGIFWILWERGWVLRDWYDPLQGLSAAAMVVLCLWPWSAHDLGFQLSFSATAGIVLGWPVFRDSPWRGKLPRFLRSVADLFWVSLCAQGATLGFVGSAFGYIPLYGVLANLLLIPWTGAIIWTGLSLLVLSPAGFAPALGEVAEKFLIQPYLATVSWVSNLPGAALPVGRHFGVWWAFAALVLVAFWSESPRGSARS